MIYIQKFTCNPFSENTYVIYNDAQNAFIVDPGNIHDFENEAISNFIEEKKLNVKNILLTHAHIDHVLGLQWAYDLYKVPVLMHADDKELLDRNPMTARQYGFQFSPFEGEIQYISEKDSLELDNDVFAIYHVPGHAPGHLAFHYIPQDILVSGDVLFEGSIGRTDLYKGDFEQLLESIRTKLFILNDRTVVYSGHGNETNIGFEKQHNPFLK